MLSGLQDAWHIECLLEKEEVTLRERKVNKFNNLLYPGKMESLAYWLNLCKGMKIH